jgi:isochorismate hydrolase
VASSAWDGFEQGFHILIADDACAAYEEDLHSHALKALALSGAELARTDVFAGFWKNLIKSM